MSKRPKNSGSNVSGGFTLLEIIVAVAIFGVIASIVFPALLQFLDMRERVDEKHQQISGLQKTFQFWPTIYVLHQTDFLKMSTETSAQQP